MKTIKTIARRQIGNALPITLALLIIGGLAIVPGLNLTFSSAKSSQILETGIRGTYAAEAGVEDALWSLANDLTPPSQLAGYVNDMQVNIQTVDKGTHTIYLGELLDLGEHIDYMSVTSNVTWDEEVNAYKYTITIYWLPESGEPTISLEEVGARIPVNYTYRVGSAANFTGNISTGEPAQTLDSQGAYLLNWELSAPYPRVSENVTERTQIFYMNGTGEQDDNYAWMLARREDIGAVGEIMSTAYEITATAKNRDNKTTANITTKALIWGDKVYINYWQIKN